MTAAIAAVIVQRNCVRFYSMTQVVSAKPDETG
jgi:hypothetical protein